MEIGITYLPYLSVLTKRMREKLILQEGSTLGDLIEALQEKYGESIQERLLTDEKELKPFIMFLVNGTVIQSRALNFQLNPLDSVVIGMAAVGG